MNDDEQQIRDLVTTWMDATKAGDVATLLSLITDDVVFLTPGNPPMTKSDFAAASHIQASAGAPRIDGNVDIQELQLVGDWAFIWTKISVTMTPQESTQSTTSSGNTLTIFRKQDDRWLLARDANMLAPEKTA